jgi:hypothetical protein
MFQNRIIALGLQNQSRARLRLRGGRRDQGDGRRPGFASRSDRRICC